MNTRSSVCPGQPNERARLLLPLRSILSCAVRVGGVRLGSDPDGSGRSAGVARVDITAARRLVWAITHSLSRNGGDGGVLQAYCEDLRESGLSPWPSAEADRSPCCPAGLNAPPARRSIRARVPAAEAGVGSSPSFSPTRRSPPLGRSTRGRCGSAPRVQDRSRVPWRASSFMSQADGRRRAGLSAGPDNEDAVERAVRPGGLVEPCLDWRPAVNPPRAGGIAPARGGRDLAGRGLARGGVVGETPNLLHGAEAAAPGTVVVGAARAGSWATCSSCRLAHSSQGSSIRCRARDCRASVAPRAVRGPPFDRGAPCLREQELGALARAGISLPGRAGIVWSAKRNRQSRRSGRACTRSTAQASRSALQGSPPTGTPCGRSPSSFASRRLEPPTRGTTRDSSGAWCRGGVGLDRCLYRWSPPFSVSHRRSLPRVGLIRAAGAPHAGVVGQAAPGLARRRGPGADGVGRALGHPTTSKLVGFPRPVGSPRARASDRPPDGQPALGGHPRVTRLARNRSDGADERSLALGGTESCPVGAERNRSTDRAFPFRRELTRAC